MIKTIPQIKQSVEKTHDAILVDKANGLKNNVAESYVVYSIYYADEPEKGYVVYSQDQQGWDFFGYMPATDHAQFSQQRISCHPNGLL